MAEILHALQEIKFGSIEIIIHNSQVVQIERKEKVRFNGQTGFDVRTQDKDHEA